MSQVTTENESIRMMTALFVVTSLLLKEGLILLCSIIPLTKAATENSEFSLSLTQNSLPGIIIKVHSSESRRVNMGSAG